MKGCKGEAEEILSVTSADKTAEYEEGRDWIFCENQLCLTTGSRIFAFADFGTMHKSLLEKKRFIDMTGNNVNHPNDFLIRCHAQYISAMLIEMYENK